VLAAPVSVTRGGITVSVNRATLTADQTQINFGISGVPLSAYPKGEAVSGCIEPEYIRLPDGTRADVNAPIPVDINEVTFVVPCIFNTLSGTVPQDWELPLRFVPAPPSLTVLPVIELTPTLQATSLAPTPTGADGTGTPAEGQASWVSIEKVIETSDGYILIGAFRPRISNGGWAQVSGIPAQVTGIPQILDASGKKVDYTIPPDINLSSPGDMNNGGFLFAFQIKAAGLAFPLTLRFQGEIYSPADPPATAVVEFDAGANPQPGQEWVLNQDVQLGAYSVRLVSIMALPDGYIFQIDPQAGVSPPSVQIEGYQTISVGGGNGGMSLEFAELPQGKLKLLFSNLFVVTATPTWEVNWQPDTLRTDWPTPTAAPASVCLNADTFNQAKPLPAGFDGQALLTVQNPKLGLVLANLDDTQSRAIVPNGSRGTLSPDGRRLAYPGSDGITILDLISGETTLLKGVMGNDLHWSPDGMKIAFVTTGTTYGIFIVPLDGSAQRQYSDLGYESIAGWSPDGRQLYYAVPDSGGKGWLLKAVDIASGETHDLFVLENSSQNAPLPIISPNGSWIAYRGFDDGSLYIIRVDDTQGHLVIENPSGINAITGIAWSPDGGWLGVSIITPGTQDGEVILMRPQGCEAYILTSLSGELNGLLIP
jgi:hypothetical protein